MRACFSFAYRSWYRGSRKNTIPALSWSAGGAGTTVSDEPGSKGLVVLGLNVSDDPKIARELLDKHGVTFPNIVDTSKAAGEVVFSKYQKQSGRSAVPLNYLIDREGKVARAWYGDDTGLDLAPYLKK